MPRTMHAAAVAHSAGYYARTSPGRSIIAGQHDLLDVVLLHLAERVNTGAEYGMSQSNAYPNHDTVAAARARVEDLVEKRRAAKEAARQGREA